MIFRWEHSFCHHNNFFYYLCEKRVWSFWSCKVVWRSYISFGGNILNSYITAYRILHRCASCQVLRDFPLEFRWQEVNPCRTLICTRLFFWEKKHNHLAKKYKLVIISWSIHNHISCDWTISVCSVYTNKIGTKTTGFEYKVRVACQSYVCHMPTTTPLIYIS